MIWQVEYPWLFSADGVSNIKVVVSDENPGDEVTEDELEGDDFTDFGSHKDDVDETEKIKIKPSQSVPGQYVVIYVPGEGELSLADVKVYVKPTAAPGEPEGPGGTYSYDSPLIKSLDLSSANKICSL